MLEPADLLSAQASIATTFFIISQPPCIIVNMMNMVSSMVMNMMLNIMMNTTMLEVVNMKPVDLLSAEDLIATIVPVHSHWSHDEYDQLFDDEYDQLFDDEYDQSFHDEYAQLWLYSVRIEISHFFSLINQPSFKFCWTCIHLICKIESTTITVTLVKNNINNNNKITIERSHDTD